MLKWLATQFERRRGALQARLEGHLRDKLALTPERQRSTELRQQGNDFLAVGNLEQAEQCYRQGVIADPKDAACHATLGYVLYEQGRRADAEASLERAVKLDQTDYDAYYLLGNISRDRQELPRAIVCYRTALRLKPDFDFCRRELCVALAQSGKIEEAQKVVDEGPSFDVDSAPYYFFKGNLHNARGQLAEAMNCLEKAAILSPSDPSILVNLSAVQLQRMDAIAAIETGHRILELDPGNAQAFSLLASAHQFSGRYDLTVECYRKSLQLDPNHLGAHQNMLNAMTYLADLSPPAYLEEARRYSSKVTARATPFTKWKCEPWTPGSRPLRVGLVSGDLCFHSVGLFLRDVLEHLDSAKVACIAYYNREEIDEYTLEIKRFCCEWNVVTTLNDAALAQKIHDDRIDILLDLSGHTGRNRLAMFAWCPAPVQAAWLGFWASTGLSEIDYLLVDRTCVHEDEAANFSEKLWFLPDTRLCLSASPVPALVSPLPAPTKGFVTFGSFQTPIKITNATLAVWADVMARLPTARLRLQCRGFEFPGSTSRMLERLATAQIDCARVELLGTATFVDYLAAYSDVDILLDTLPFPGGTTTAQALWMGVPTVTLRGETLVTRQGESMLRCVGLDDWVAPSTQDYIRIACEKAADLQALSTLRETLRDRFLKSPLADSVRFARNLEVALEEMVTDKQNRTTREVNPNVF